MRISNLIGIDDAPFDRDFRGDVPLVGTVWARSRLDGVVTGRVRKDGANATRAVVCMVRGSPFDEHVRLVLLQGIAFGGFNVVDLDALHRELGRPVLVVARSEPDLDAIRDALLRRVPGGARKWRLIEAAGPMEPAEGVWIQRRGITRDATASLLREQIRHGRLPEPLRIAHLVAGAMVRGVSGGPA